MINFSRLYKYFRTALVGDLILSIAGEQHSKPHCLELRWIRSWQEKFKFEDKVEEKGPQQS